MVAEKSAIMFFCGENGNKLIFNSLCFAKTFWQYICLYNEQRIKRRQSKSEIKKGCHITNRNKIENINYGKDYWY